MVLQELIFHSFYFGRVWLVLTELICKQFLLLGRCGVLEITDF